MLIQKFHSCIHLGRQLTAAGSRHPLFSRQGYWDGGGTLHSVAMALALLGKLADPAYVPYYNAGNEQALWDAAWPHYLHGLTLSELAGFIAELDLGVRPATCTATGNDLLGFVERELHAGWPVIIGWRQNRPILAHAALVTGIEGRQQGRRFALHALLLLDPAGNSPELGAFNARISRHNVGRMRYLSPTATRAVTLEGAVSIRLLSSATGFS